MEKRKVIDLKNWDKNPRKISAEAFEKLKQRIISRGFHDVIKLDTNGIILSGNQRKQALLQLGISEVDVRVPDRELTEEERCKIALESNRNDGADDYDLLADFGEDILQDVGFTQKELDKIYDLKDKGDDFDSEKEAEKIVVAVAQPGEVYQLGPHRLMCGDSTNPADVEKLMAGEKADMIFTDPPYNVNYAGRGEKTSTHIKNDNMDSEVFRQFLLGAFRNCYNFSKDVATIYSCYASRTHREFEDALNQAGYEVRNQIIWVKLVASMGWGDYRWKHEPILYCHKTGNAGQFYGDRSQYTEWKEELDDMELLKRVKAMIEREEKGESTVWRLKRDSNYDHPTQKPLQLCKIAITNSCVRGGLVLDLFGGGGSTLIAAGQAGRRANLMELDPRFVDVIIKRWEQESGEKAVKIG